MVTIPQSVVTILQKNVPYPPLGDHNRTYIKIFMKLSILESGAPGGQMYLTLIKQNLQMKCSRRTDLINLDQTKLKNMKWSQDSNAE